MYLYPHIFAYSDYYTNQIISYLIMKKWNYNEAPKVPFGIPNLLGPAQPGLRM